MSDTGAPWNLPYPLPTGLVRDGAQDIEDLAEAVATGLTAAGNAGIGSNVVQTVKTNFFSTSSTSLTDITGFTASITPSTASSLVLVLFSANLGVDSANVIGITLLRGSTQIYVGTAGVDRNFSGGTAPSNAFNGFATSGVFLDSPASAASVTYKMQMRLVAGTGFLNRRGDGTGDGYPSHITLVEVAA